MKKGFTLIEIISVILVLAIIGMIISPIIFKAIQSSREKAYDSQVATIIESAKNWAISNNNLLPTGDDEYQLPLSTLINEQYIKNVKDGKLKNPKDKNNYMDGCVYIHYSSNYNQYMYEYKDECTNTQNAVSTFAGTIDTTKQYLNNVEQKGLVGVAYLDPTDLTATCNETLALANVNEYGAYTGINTGCMRFYIFNEDNIYNTYTMILDHNTSGNVAWNSDNTNTVMKEVAARLASDTVGWVGNPRLIDADEVATIVEKTNWSKTTTTIINNFSFGSKNRTMYSSQTEEQKSIQQSYAWLFDNLYESTNYGGSLSDDNMYPYGTKTSSNLNYIYDYWTSSSAISSANSSVWQVTRAGSLDEISAMSDRPSGVRPVITLAKSTFSN